MKNKLLIIVLIMFCIMFTTPVYAYNYWRCDGIKLIKTGNTELENPTNKPNIDECGIIVKPGETFKDANKCYEEKNQGSYFVYEATTEPTYKVSKDQISVTNYSCHAQSRGSCTGLSIKEECELFSESCKWEADSCKTKPTTTKVTTTGGAIVPVTFSSGNMSEMLDVCESSGTLQVIYVAKIVFAFICYAVPILITITLTIDISKVVTDPTQVKKVVDVAKKRILIGLLLLFTPTLVKLLINSLGSDSDLQRCYNNAKPSHIKARKEYEREYFSTHSTHTVRESTTRTVVGVPLSLSKSDEWVVNNNRSEGLFGYYLYVPKNPKTNMPLVIIFPGDNRFCDTCGETNSSSDLMYSYFINNYGSGKKYNYSDAFILIPKIDYTPYENITTIINNFVNSTPLVDNKTINNLQIDKSRMSIVGFSTGASVIFSYATKYKSSVSAMLVVSSGANVGAVTGDLNFYKQLPMKGTAEGQGDQTYASSTRAIFETLGKKSQFTLANDYKHRDMHIFVFSRDENGDRFNDYIEWLISQQRGGGSTLLPYTTTTDELWWPIGSSETQIMNSIKFAYKDPIPSSISLGFQVVDAVHTSGHDGIDIAAEKGSNLIAIADGTIVEGTDIYSDHGHIDYDKLQCGDPSHPEYYKYVNYINIKLVNGLEVRYGHIMQGSIPDILKNSDGTVKVGAKVYKGQVVAQVGNTGCSTGPHCHFMIVDGGPKDPEKYVKKDNPRPGLKK